MQTKIHDGTFLLEDVNKMIDTLGKADDSPIFPLEVIRGKVNTAYYMCNKHKPDGKPNPLPGRYKLSVDVIKNKRQKLFNNKTIQRRWLVNIAKQWSIFEGLMQRLQSDFHDQFASRFVEARNKDQQNDAQWFGNLVKVCLYGMHV